MLEKSVVKSVTEIVTSKAIVYEKIRNCYYEKCNGKLFKWFAFDKFDKRPLRGATFITLIIESFVFAQLIQ